MNVMTKCGIAFAILIGMLLPSSAWAVSQGASCRGGARPQKHATEITLLCWVSQDPWQDCNEDPWQLSSWGSSRDTFLDPWQDKVDDGGDPWQPFVAKSVAKLLARRVPAAAHDSWQAMQIRVVKISSVTAVRDAVEDPWQPAFADPWQDDVEDPWQ
jgi:hypothetical protein